MYSGIGLSVPFPPYIPTQFSPDTRVVISSLHTSYRLVIIISPRNKLVDLLTWFVHFLLPHHSIEPHYKWSCLEQLLYVSFGIRPFFVVKYYQCHPRYTNFSYIYCFHLIFRFQESVLLKTITSVYRLYNPFEITSLVATH